MMFAIDTNNCHFNILENIQVLFLKGCHSNHFIICSNDPVIR